MVADFMVKWMKVPRGKGALAAEAQHAVDVAKARYMASQAAKKAGK